MLFSSTLFLFLFLFLPVVLLGHALLQERWRNPWLLLTSFVFYAWGEPAVVTVMLLTIIANWAIGLWAERARSSVLPLLAALAFNIGLLVFFKYTDFLTHALSDLLLLVGLRTEALPLLSTVWPKDSALYGVLFTPQGNVRLPIGISFFTFQALSYVIDIRRGEVRAQRNPLILGTYKSLFPQLIAGPIVRYRDVQDQFGSRRITVDLFTTGVYRFVTGLGKKMLIANTAAEIADAAFAIPGDQLPASVAWLGIFCYTVQIYFDFSGYSDMAIGLGLMLGFRFLENFDYPYIARSITEFWRRWHISLSTWFRDYLYIPLGGNRCGPVRTLCNLVLVFALCGFWHGASFNFLVWGLYHGLFLVLERLGLRSLLERSPAAVRHGYTLLAVMIGWVFFRAETLPKALEYLQAMAGASGAGTSVHHVGLHLTSWSVPMLAAAVVGAVPIVPRLAAWVRDRNADGDVGVATLGYSFGLVALVAVFAVSCMLMAAGTYNPFIYFRF